MKGAEKWTKTEIVLLALTMVFLVCTGVMFMLRTAGSAQATYTIRAEGTQSVSEEATLPEKEMTPPAPEPPTPECPLNINTASAAELDLLPGIGETLAGRIVAYREENGAFAEPEDIMKVEGIGEGIYADIQELITVEEAAT